MTDRIQDSRGPVARFLGDTPLRVAVKLVVLSVLVGMVMQFFGWSPRDIFDAVQQAVRDVWNMGFDAFDSIIGWFLLGAVIVVPLFLVSRFLNLSR